MRMVHEITLRGTSTTSSATGYATQTPTDVTVFADKVSIKRSEFYAADANGDTLDIAFVVHADEYDGQTEVVYGSVTYKVVRTYQRGLGRVELNCQRR